MKALDIVTVIVFGIAIVLFGINLLREIFTFRDIKSNFYCSNCNTFNDEISRIGKCKNCNRTFKIKGKTWDHLLLHRTNWIPTYSKGEVFKWKEYRKLSVIEIALNCIAIIILGLAIVLIVL